jgi:hypothetical protein
MFILGDGRTVVSQHYGLDETKFPCIPSRRPQGVAAFARVLPADDPYNVDFVPPSAFVVFGAAPCTAASGTVVDGEACCAAACYSRPRSCACTFSGGVLLPQTSPPRAPRACARSPTSSR